MCSREAAGFLDRLIVSEGETFLIHPNLEVDETDQTTLKRSYWLLRLNRDTYSYLFMTGEQAGRDPVSVTVLYRNNNLKGK